MVLFVLLLASIVAPILSKVTIQDGGYGEITVHIEESTLPIMQHFLVPKIKELFTSASSYLHTATGHRLYFRDVIILVPSHWPGDYEPYVTSEDAFDITVTKNSDWPTPRTMQSGGCEEGGDVIRMSQAFLKSSLANKERFLVREWAKYRYGVFDESGSDVTYPATYWRDETLLPNLCSNVPLNAVFSWGCSSDAASVSHECHFSLPASSNADVTSSVMADSQLPSVTSFCNATTHQPHLPNRQNILCHYRSVWDVIGQHPDLQNPIPSLDLNTVPEFRLMKKPELAIAMIIDSSNETAEILHALQQTTAEFFRDILPRGTLLRVIEHGGGQEHDIRPWGTIDTKKQVEALVNDMPHAPEGMAALPLAVDVALEALNKTTRQNSVLLVINSDCAGLQAFEPGITDQLLIWRTRLVLFCLEDPHRDPITDQAHQHPHTPFLIHLQRDVGAHLFVSHPHGDVMSVLRGAFRKTIGAEAFGNATVTLVDRYLSESQSHFVALDPHVTDNLTVTFTYNVKKSVGDVMVVPPSGNVIILDRSPHCIRDIQRMMITCRVEKVEPGEWRVIIGADQFHQDLRMHVTARCHSQCLTLTSWVTDFDSKKNATQVPRVFGYLQRFGLPVQGAELVAIVTSRYYPQHTARFHMKDNGLDPDTIASDGVYSAYLAPLQEGGWHYVTVQTTNQHLDFPLTRPAIFYQRVSFTGSVWIEPGEASETDDSALYPPSRILDLSAEVADADSLLVRVQWAAPGADFNNGTAAAYDFRWSHSHVTLREGFSTANPVAPSDIMVGDLRPLKAGSRQVVVVRLVERRSVYLAIRAVDRHATTAATSNIASIARRHLLKNKAKPNPTPTPSAVTTHLALDSWPNPSPSPVVDDAPERQSLMKVYLLVLVVLTPVAVMLISLGTCAILHRLVKIDKHFRSGSYDFAAERNQFLVMENVHGNDRVANDV